MEDLSNGQLTQQLQASSETEGEDWPQVDLPPLPQTALRKQCQWIDAETPITYDDSCKCMAPTNGEIYCLEHKAKSIRADYQFKPVPLVLQEAQRMAERAIEDMIKSNAYNRPPFHARR